MRNRTSRSIFTARNTRKRGCLLYVGLLILIIGAVYAVNMVNNSRVALNEQSITISALPASLENFRILHISDLHASLFGAGQKNLYATIKNKRYDAVCITGDMVGKSGDFGPFIQLIKLIPKEVPVFFIHGDDDPEAIQSHAHGNSSVYADFILEAAKHGAVYLDSPHKITKGKAVIWFLPESVIGLDIESAKASLQKNLQLLSLQDPYEPDNAAMIRADQYRMELMNRIASAQSEIRQNDIQIALSHQPLNTETVRTLQRWAEIESNDFFRKISLILAGHFNNGQFRIPFLGAVYVPASSGLGNRGWFPDNSLVSGLSEATGTAQYISPGLGVSGAYPYFPMRLFNPPAVTLIELTSKIIDTGV